MAKNNNIIVAHVGGRAGSISFPENKFFSNEINKIIFEADNKSLDQIKEIHTGSKALNYFVGKDKEKVILNLNYCPYTSSSYHLNKEFENFYHKGAKNTDYVYKHVIKTKKKISLISRSLDSLYKDNIIEAPDFLSLDTQGSEFEILLSSKKLLKNNLLAVSCEVNFSELYSNTKLFSEIHELLLANNFILVDLRTFNIGCHRIPIKFRGRGIPLQGEALYFKKPNKLKLDSNKQTKLKKLAFIAISYGYTEFAYKIIDQISFKKITTVMEYEKFLKIFYDEVRQLKSMPKLWNNVFTFKQSLERFNSSLKKKNNPTNLLYKILNKIIKIIKFDKKDLSFINFLKKYDFHIAAQEVKSRIEGKL